MGTRCFSNKKEVCPVKGKVLEAQGFFFQIFLKKGRAHPLGFLPDFF
jgi:hypothetical protein